MIGAAFSRIAAVMSVASLAGAMQTLGERVGAVVRPKRVPKSWTTAPHRGKWRGDGYDVVRIERAIARRARRARG